jgi:HAD superfamily phosphoserine phosphatase-like hydrolase
MKVFIFDFDGTITTKDTTDLILEIPGKDEIWRIEEKWKNGSITSYQCMKAQAKFLKGITVKEIHECLIRNSRIDPNYSNLLHFLKVENFYNVILSESYDLSIRFHEVQKCIDEIYYSKLLTENGRLTGELNVLNERIWDYNDRCLGCCICKVDFLQQLSKQFNVTQTVAVGDGGSDQCLFQYTDISFSLNPKYDATYTVKDLSEVLNILVNLKAMQ